MSSFKLLNTEVKSLTPELALVFRDMTPSPTERDLNPGRLKHLRQKADAGYLTVFSWAIAKIGDRLVRINGQTSSTMLCQLNGSFPEGLMVNVSTYEVDDDFALAMLFKQFDDRRSARGCADISGSFQNSVPVLREIPKGVGKIGIEGIAWYRWEAQRAPVQSGDDIYSLFFDEAYHPFLLWLGELFKEGIGHELKSRAVIASLYATYSANFGAQKEDARLFWALVARGGVEYEDDAPATVLSEWLKAATDKTLPRDPRKIITPHALYSACIYAWNMSRRGKAMKRVKCDVVKGEPLIAPV
jgi:hypothetical protein